MVFKLFDDPVICYEFLKTLSPVVKTASDFWNYAALRFVVTERSAAITERNATYLP